MLPQDAAEGRYVPDRLEMSIHHGARAMSDPDTTGTTAGDGDPWHDDTERARYWDAQNASAEPDILDDLDEMWPILAGAEGGRIYQPGEIAAVMLLAACEIRRLRETCRVFQKGHFKSHPSALC
jgi:hypothetical protein